MNGAGVCKSVDDVADLARSCLAAVVVVGSITVASRAGNPEDMAEYLAVGATCVQATTAFAGSRNPGVFAKILSEYVNCR
jgi:dihydroorotate dehydrogenase